MKGILSILAAGAANNNNDMRSNIISNGTAEHKIYITPFCYVSFVGAPGVICASETEKVTEEEGEW